MHIKLKFSNNILLIPGTRFSAICLRYLVCVWKKIQEEIFFLFDVFLCFYEKQDNLFSKNMFMKNNYPGIP